MKSCIGIISYFPDTEPLRTNRKNSFKALLKNLETYFKLPIVIAAQNWEEDDFNIDYQYGVKVYSFNQQLGVTGARINLQDQLLRNHNEYDYYIFLDDDSNLEITEEGVNTYFNELNSHPGMVGIFRGCWWRLLAISNEMLHKTNFNYIRNMESIRGEVWEDYCWKNVWSKIYPGKFFKFSMNGITDVFIGSENDPNTTWYKEDKEFENSVMLKKSMAIAKDWYRTEMLGSKRRG